MPIPTTNFSHPTYHVVNGAKGSSYYTGSMTITAGTAYGLYSGNSRGTTFSGGVFYGSGGYPGGKTGVYSNLAGVAFDTVSVQDQNPQQDLLGRWEGTKYQITSSGSLALYNASGASGPLFMKNLRLQKFQTTFSFNRPDTYAYQRVWFAFNATDQDNYDMVSFTADGSGGYGPETYSITNDVASWVSGTTANCPACGSTGVMWCRVQFDGTTLKAWALVKTDGSTPSETDWSTSATQVASVTSYRNSGGKIGFAQPDGGDPTQLSNVTIKSYKNSTSAWVTEATEDFSVDTNNFASDNSTNLASDSNGNQTFDGTQVYTYDAWNRLITVSHGYRDSSNNLQHGQAAVTMGYDAKGRRITKAIVNTGNWDCSYNYYHTRDSVIEEQNGSAQTIKQFVWGLQYIDELIQTSLNSSPTSQSICDTPYWAEQDANFNLLGIINSSGALAERYEFGAYGQRTPYISAGSNDTFCTAATTASTRFNASGTAEPWGLCEVGHQGLMHDEECGLVYNRARYLSPATGRFLSEDPAQYTDSQNLYQYVTSDPADLSDPTGLGVMTDGQTMIEGSASYQSGYSNVETQLNTLAKQWAAANPGCTVPNDNAVIHFNTTISGSVYDPNSLFYNMYHQLTIGQFLVTVNSSGIVTRTCVNGIGQVNVSWTINLQCLDPWHLHTKYHGWGWDPVFYWRVWSWTNIYVSKVTTKCNCCK